MGSAFSSNKFNQQELTLSRKFWRLNWGLMLLLTLIACVGFAMLYSAAKGSWDPWASRQVIRFSFGFVVMIIIALVDLKFWMRVAYILYGISFLLRHVHHYR